MKTPTRRGPGTSCDPNASPVGRFGPARRPMGSEGVTPLPHTRDMTCSTCDPTADEVWTCHEIGVRHADGSAECLGDHPCDLPVDLHHWQVRCDELDPPCRCGSRLRLADPSPPVPWHPASGGRPASPAAA